MALGLTQPLTEMRTRNISWRGKGGRCVGPIVLKSGSLNLLEPLGPAQACNGIVLTFLPEIFRTVALGLTRPPTEMSTKNIPWRGKGGRCVRPIVLKFGSFNLL